MKFYQRHIGTTKSEEKYMLDYLGLENIDSLINKTIPKSIRMNKALNVDSEMSEAQFLDHMFKQSQKNKHFKNLIGLGYNESILPPVIQRNILENPGWYTAYTPYQAEIAQGRLEALLNFQTVICDLTGMEMANASLLDEGTAAAEAMTMIFSNRSREKVKNNSLKFFISNDTFEQTIKVIQTRAEPLGISIIIDDIKNVKFDESFFGCYIQYIGNHGKINDLKKVSNYLKAVDVKLIVGSDLLALAILEEPAKSNCDVVVGTSQRFGIPLGFGGPHAGYFATKSSYKRHIPGRIIGLSKDRLGNTALRMALQTREQHIKRERATSNICTAQVLLAVMAGMYAVYHGPKGIRSIAQKINNLANILNNNLKDIGVEQLNSSFFDTIHLKTDTKKLEKLFFILEISYF